MNTLKLIPLIVALALLSACASNGVGALKDENLETLESQFVEGSTNKTEILQALGRPTNTSFTDSGREVLTYAYTELTPRARNFIPYNLFSKVTDASTKELVMLVGRDGVLERLVFNETETERRWGIAE